MYWLQISDFYIYGNARASTISVVNTKRAFAVFSRSIYSKFYPFFMLSKIEIAIVAGYFIRKILLLFDSIIEFRIAMILVLKQVEKKWNIMKLKRRFLQFSRIQKNAISKGKRRAHLNVIRWGVVYHFGNALPVNISFRLHGKVY